MLAIDYDRPFKAVVMDLARNSPGGAETIRQFALIFALQEATKDSERTTRALAAKLKVGKPAITRAVDTLVQDRVIKRRKDPKDGRNVFFDLIDVPSVSVAGRVATR